MVQMTSDPNLQQQFKSTTQPDDIIASLSPGHMYEADANDEEQCQQGRRRDHKRKDISEAQIIEG